MNVYEKLATARVEFQNRKPKMSGKNSFAGYTYFELSDILPVINQIGKDIGFVAIVSFSKDIGSLLFIDSEKPTDVITFESPMSTASLKGCHEVQNLGAVETYVKRYLYQNAFEIVESDALNSTQGKPGAEFDEKKPAGDAEKARRAALAKRYTELIDTVDECDQPIYDATWKAKWNARLKEAGYTVTIKEIEADLGGNK